MSAARQGWLQAALGAAAGAAAAALLLRRRQRSNLCDSTELDSADDPLRRFRKCEAVVCRRNSRVVVVIERCNESHNCAARCHFLQPLDSRRRWRQAPRHRCDAIEATVPFPRWRQTPRHRCDAIDATVPFPHRQRRPAHRGSPRLPPRMGRRAADARRGHREAPAAASKKRLEAGRR